MKCPLRVIESYDYTVVGETPCVTKSQADYAECYEENCPCWKYEVGKGFYCIQFDLERGNDYE